MLQLQVPLADLVLDPFDKAADDDDGEIDATVLLQKAKATFEVWHSFI